MANELTFEQISSVLTDIVKAATGQTFTSPIDTSSFVNLAQIALKTGYDPLNTAISQVMTRTIFSTRPYSAKFRGFEMSRERFGNATRKLQISDQNWEDDNRFELVDGKSIDQYVVKKPKVLQTNFYGSNVFSDFITIYKDQLDCAFRSPDELAQFFAMVMTNMSDRMEQARENLTRSALANLICSTNLIGNTESNVHILTEYNNATGESLTPTSVYAPANYKAFMQWACARIAQISGLMSERSLLYHQNVTGKPVMHHTPLERQKVYISALQDFQFTSRVLADSYHDNFVRLADHESVNFWQDIKDPNTISCEACYTKTDGTLAAKASVTVENLFGVIFDEEAAGWTEVNRWMMPTPMNAAGGYTNYHYHFTNRYFNDNLENCCVITLD